MSGTMKAVICNAFGPIEQLAVESVPTPVPKADEILIKIEAQVLTFQMVC